MPSLFPKKRNQRILFIAVASLVLIGAGFGAFTILKPIVKKWRDNRPLAVAHELLAKGDYVNAIQATRKALSYNQGNIEAWKLGVEISEKQESPHIFYYQQNLAALAPTLENNLKFLRIAKKLGAYPQAYEVIGKMGAEAAKSPEFFELAAEICQRLGKRNQAKLYFVSLVGLQPSNTHARFELAQIRLVDGNADNKPSIRAELRELSNDPALRTRGLSLLLADSLTSKNERDSLELSDRLVEQSDLTPPTHLLIAQTYNLYAPKRLASYLAKLKQAYTGQIDSTLALANYLTTHDRASEACDWIDSLDDTVRQNENVQVMYAQALAQKKDWARFESYLKGTQWKENEFIRHTYLAFNYHRLSDERAFADSWRLALIEAGTNRRRLEHLLNLISPWGWTDQKMDIYWKKFQLDPSDKSIRNTLITRELTRGNTLGLNKLYAQLTDTEPSDREFKNNFAYTSLLLNSSIEQAFKLARENHLAAPENAYFTTTFALALFKQGKAQDALELVESLGAATLTVKERILLRSVLLVANNRIEEGAELATFLTPSQFLPEERALLVESTALVAKARRTQADATRLTTLVETAPASANRKPWLTLLPASLRSKDIQLNLADNLYGSDDFKGLESSLRSEHWENNDFLRLSLLSYAQKNLGKPADSSATWRLALTAAGGNAINLTALKDMCERWSWAAERIDLVARLFQRDPSNTAALAELTAHYSQNGQTIELAKIYSAYTEGTPADSEAKARLAYYSLLSGTNLSAAHVLAKESHDKAPENAFISRIYAFSLLRQNRPADAWSTLEALPLALGEQGHAQLALIKAAVAQKLDQKESARASLKNFDRIGVLPEEIALANTLSKALDTK